MTSHPTATAVVPDRAAPGARTSTAATSPTSALRRFLPLLSRIGAAVLGGYAFCWGVNALGLAGFYRLGMSFHDAEHLSGILGVLTYLVVFLWTFAAAKIWKAWALLLVGGGLMTGAATLIQRSMLAGG